jgi:hypothetical protein
VFYCPSQARVARPQVDDLPREDGQRIEHRLPFTSNPNASPTPQLLMLTTRPTTLIYSESPCGKSPNEAVNAVGNVEILTPGHRSISPISDRRRCPRVQSSFYDDTKSSQASQPPIILGADHKPAPTDQRALLRIECPICGRGFDRLIQLKGHLLSHGETPVRALTSNSSLSILTILRPLKPRRRRTIDMPALRGP